MTIISGETEANQMCPAKMALLVTGHAAFLATFVWLFH
jgi:hypothetical protein